MSDAEDPTSTGDTPILRHLCRDAMRLTQLLAAESSLSNSDTVALIQASRDRPDGPATAAVLVNLYARVGSDEPARYFRDEALRTARTPHERELVARQFDRSRRRVSPAAESA